MGVLNDMFDKLDWMVARPHVNTRGIHGYGCACNPKSVRVLDILKFTVPSLLKIRFKLLYVKEKVYSVRCAASFTLEVHGDGSSYDAL